MRYRPHDYQTYATRFIEEQPVAALILGMGLGKSVITLTAIEHLMHDSFEVRKVLVIAPLRVAVSTWPDEIRKWDHLSSLTFSVAVGTRGERIAALKQNTDITIINRENIQWLVEESGVPFDYDMVVIDELSSFKNHRTKRFRSLMKARPKVKRIVGLTGTPVPNGLMDLWAEFRLLDGGKRLGRFIGQYRERWFLPDKRNQMVVFSYKPKEGAEDEIYSAIADITVSMKAMDRIRMPELIETEMKVSMSGSERKAYDSMKKDLVLSLPDGAVTASNAASLSGKLMQLSSGAVYTDEEAFTEIHRRKLDALEDAIESMNGKPLLIAYWFRHERTRISGLLTNLGIPWKEISDEASIREWNEGMRHLSGNGTRGSSRRPSSIQPQRDTGSISRAEEAPFSGSPFPGALSFISRRWRGSGDRGRKKKPRWSSISSQRGQSTSVSLPHSEGRTRRRKRFLRP